MNKSNKRATLLTGIRASGDIHLGNYLGAMKPAIALQNEYDSYLFIADYHGLTTTPPAEELRQSVRSIAATWLSIGLDPSKTVIWKQSDIPEVVELSYIFSCVTSMGLLERAHSYKDAKAKSKTVKTGLFYYPVLMAADVLLYDTDAVPVGKDQDQHLEMTRDIATFFNETYGEIFKLPKALIQKDVGVIPGIDGRKMSKSYSNAIPLFASDKEIKKQIMKIKTDSKSLEEPKEPEECLVYQIYKTFAPAERVSEMASKLKAGNYGYGDAKKTLLQDYLNHIDSMRKSYDDWMQDDNRLDEVLRDGALRAREKARKMMSRIRTMVGL